MPIMEQRILSFLEDLSSRAPTPGGGSASALVGAVAAALCGMVGRLNDRPSGEAGPLHETITAADAWRERLAGLADEDIQAFNALMAAWKLPDDDPGKPARKQEATFAATRTPLEIMRQAMEVMRLAAAGLEKSKKSCLSDAGIAAIMAHAALEGARLNVMINLPSIADERQRAELRAQADALRAEAKALRAKADAIIATKYGR